MRNQFYTLRHLLIYSLRFRWVFCQLQTLRYCLPPSVRRVLAELPETLDETYERILSEIPKSNRVHAHRLLQCLTAAVRPLRVEELAEVLAIDFDTTEGIPKLKEDLRWEDQEQAVLSACSSLIAVVGDEWFRVVHFSHFSVKEFLTSDRLATSKVDGSRYHHILLEPAHTIMAQACLGVLLRLDYDIDNEKIMGFPLAGYAAYNLGDHAEFENVLSHIRDGVDYLLDADKPHLAAWIWVRGRHEEHPPRLSPVPLYYMADFGHLYLVHYLISKRPEDVDAISEDGTPLHAASRKGHVKILRMLLGHCVNVNARNFIDQTPLHLAVDLVSLEVVRMLIEHNADINARDDKGRTPLHRFLSLPYLENHFDLASFLIGHGADVDTKDNHYSTPLHDASYYGGVETTQLLLEHGANIHARNEDGQTPLHWTLVDAGDSVLDRVFDAARFLLAHGADVDTLDNNHSTPLHEAASCGGVKAAQLLLEHGANVHIRNKDGKSPFQVASTDDHEELAQLLSEHLQCGQ